MSEAATLIPSDEEMFHITVHALERYHLKYPGARHLDMHRAIRDGEEISPEAAHAVTGRAARRITFQKGNRYILHPHRTGMFAITTDNNSVVTFLRFDTFQEREVMKIWPIRQDKLEEETKPEEVVKVVQEKAPEPPKEAPERPTEEPLAPRQPFDFTLPHLQVRPESVRISAVLLDDFSDYCKDGERPPTLARRSLNQARDTLVVVSEDHCTIQIPFGEEEVELHLIRRREAETRGFPEWWLVSEVPAPLPNLELQMAEMLRRRGWNVFPPPPESE